MTKHELWCRHSNKGLHFPGPCTCTQIRTGQRGASRDGKARLLRTQIHGEQDRNGTSHSVSFEVATLTGAQAEALQVAFLEWLASLEFGK